MVGHTTPPSSLELSESRRDSPHLVRDRAGNGPQL